MSADTRDTSTDDTGTDEANTNETGRIDIGRVGLWSALPDAHPTSRVRELAAELEAMGWPCLWRPETAGRDAFVSLKR